MVVDIPVLLGWRSAFLNSNPLQRRTYACPRVLSTVTIRIADFLKGPTKKIPALRVVEEASMSTTS
jgi:hypothetical protein